jgi:hypothetical protein
MKERKERYLCSQVFIYFQDLKERSYFQVWSSIELDFHLFFLFHLFPIILATISNHTCTS